MAEDYRKIFILHKNDLESVKIAEMLENEGYVKDVDYFITEQEEPVYWKNLEPNIIDEILRRDGSQHKAIYGIKFSHDINDKLPEISQYNNTSFTFYDIEGSLREYKPYTFEKEYNGHYFMITDYIMVKDAESSIEKIAKTIDHELTEDERWIAENARCLWSYPDSDSPEIKKIKDMERKARNITPEQEAQAKEAVANSEKTDYDLTIVKIPHKNYYAVLDVVGDKCENLLIIFDGGGAAFFGNGAVVNKLKKEFNGHVGVSDVPLDVSEKYFYNSTVTELTGSLHYEYPFGKKPVVRSRYRDCYCPNIAEMSAKGYWIGEHISKNDIEYIKNIVKKCINISAEEKDTEVYFSLESETEDRKTEINKNNFFEQTKEKKSTNEKDDFFEQTEEKNINKKEKEDFFDKIKGMFSRQDKGKEPGE